MLGSAAEADDALQEAWIRASRADAAEVKNVAGWLTTIVARVCLDLLRSRKSRREEELGPQAPDVAGDPEGDVLLADSVGSALLVVLETLAPLERVAFVLHDLFGMSFDEIAPIVGRSPAATRQLASRGRRRVRGGGASPADLARRREVVTAFLAASRSGDVGALVALLAPDTVFTADEAAVRAAAANRWGGAEALPTEVRGAPAVAEVLKDRARGAELATVDGSAGAVWAPGGQVRAAFAFTVEGGKIVEIDLVVEPDDLEALAIAI